MILFTRRAERNTFVSFRVRKSTTNIYEYIIIICTITNVLLFLTIHIRYNIHNNILIIYKIFILLFYQPVLYRYVTFILLFFVSLKFNGLIFFIGNIFDNPSFLIFLLLKLIYKMHKKRLMIFFCLFC